MKIYLDDQPTDLPQGDLVDVLTAAQRHVASLGLAIVEVRLDGQTLTGDALNGHLSGQSPTRPAEVRLYSANPRLLVVEVLQQIQQQLDVARQAQDDAAEAFQQDRTGDGIQQVSQAIAVWLQVQQAVTEAAAMANLTLDDKTFEDQPVVEHIQQLIEQIKTLRDLLAQRDTLGLADALAYEWSETAGLWQRLVGQLILWIQG